MSSFRFLPFLLLSVIEVEAAQLVVSGFNDADAVAAWRFDYGSAGIENAIEFSSEDADGNAASGSMKLEIGFGPGLQQAAFTHNLSAPVDGSTMSSLEFDVKVDPASALDRFGNAVYSNSRSETAAVFPTTNNSKPTSPSFRPTIAADPLPEQ